MLDVFEEPLDHKRIRLYTEQMLGNIDSEIFDFNAHPDLFVMRMEKLRGFNNEKRRIIENEGEDVIWN